MRQSRLILRGLTYYWRTNIAVVIGVATAVAVLAGALLVGDSVRGSLRDLVVQRLGRTDITLVSAGFFREQLADDLIRHEAFAPSFAAVAPLISVQGVVTVQESGRRVGRVRVYGVDDRFWRFHGQSPIARVGERDVLVNEALAKEIDARTDAAILVRVQRPSAMPLESLQGRKDDLGRTLRLTVRGVVPKAALGEFSLDPQQGDVFAVFVPLIRLQEEIEVPERVNTLLVAAKPDHQGDASRQLEPILRSRATLEDIGLKVRTSETAGALIVESDAGVLDDPQAAAVEQALTASGMQPRGVFTYLANTIRHGDREIPYSLVSAIDLSTIAPASALPTNAASPAIVLDTWAATELRAAVGDRIGMDYFVWEDPGQLVSRSSDFQVVGVVPIEAGDRDLAPVYPGISDSPSLSEWNPPFPVDLRRIRPIDEAYWNRYRTTPKAFIPLEAGQRLWRSRYGAITSIRAAGENESLANAKSQVIQRLRAAIDPLTMGLAIRDVRAEGLAASRGATDFGEYFVYFSFFLVVSALLLAALFFKLGIEQRAREVGLLRAVGFGPGAVRRLFLAEGSLLAVSGSVLGTLGAVAYASLLMVGLRSWWVDAVGTTALTLHVSGYSLIAGAIGGIVAAMACIWWTLRSLAAISERSLLAGDLRPKSYGPRHAHEGRALPISTVGDGLQTVPRLLWLAAIFLLVAVVLLSAGLSGRLDATGAFFGAGSALLGASLCLCAFVLRRPARRAFRGRGWWPVSRLGMRTATYRPGRSVLSMAVIACATFILIAVSAFRRDNAVTTNDPHSGTGGYALLVESLLPVVHDPNTAKGREALNLFDLDPSVTIEPFRLLPGDDASCLNLYEPRNPRIIAPRDSFIAAGRFAFQDALASGSEDVANPWRLLHRVEPDGAIPVIADANSMTYVLHRSLGDTFVISHRGRAISLRFVAALRDSIFQGELLMSQSNFLKLFPEQEGFPLLLVDAGKVPMATVRSDIEDGLRDFGAVATGTAERLASFHRVENTYLSTFQALGGFGLLLGTVGLATVLMRNVLERRRELALLGAVGYGRGHFLLMAVAENTVLVVCGLTAGAVSAGLAIAPALVERGGRLPLTSGALLLIFSVFVVALLSSVAAMAAATRGPLLEALRAE
jgi:ABC-type lipoprotein release transport system permease subunit